MDADEEIERLLQDIYFCEIEIITKQQLIAYLKESNKNNNNKDI